MTPPDWIPTHCLHCQTYMGHEEGDWVEHDDKRGRGYRCPTCGHNWQAIPPEDWTGGLFVAVERELATPPPEYSIDQLGLKYSGPKWEEIIG